MSSSPFMQLYVGDYLADTLDLTTEQHGAYLLLLMTMWRHDAKLPNDPAKLARIARVSARRWHLVWAEIQHFFYVDGDEIRNNRLDREHQKATSISEKRIASGAAGGRAKALKNKNVAMANAADLLKHSQKSDIREEKEEPIGSSKKKSASRQVPDDFQPSDDGIEYARTKGMTADQVSAQVEQFILHHQSKGSKFVNLNRAWQTWCCNFEKFAAERAARPSNVVNHPRNPGRWVDPANGRGVEQFHPEAVCMGGGWWKVCEEIEWYKNTGETRPNKWTRDRQDAEVREALRGAI